MDRPASSSSQGALGLSSWRQTQRQLLLYGLMGGVQLLADWLCFVALTFANVDVVAANLISRVVGAALGFWLNGRHTFADSESRPSLGRKQAIRFALGWLLTAILSTAAVWMLDAFAGLGWARTGKFFVDSVLALLGFALSKYWIFR